MIAPATEGFERGRARDEGTFGDSSNTPDQSFVVLGLARSRRVPQDAVNYLLKQQCSDGFFREEQVEGETCDDSGSKRRASMRQRSRCTRWWPPRSTVPTSRPGR